jgi:cyclohexanone monooxygenase
MGADERGRAVDLPTVPQMTSAVQMTSAEVDPGRDLSALRERYREERDRRLRSGRREVPELTGDLQRYADDPYVRSLPREPIASDSEVIVVGAGFAGLVTAARLRGAGFERITILDKAGDVGGVWYWNRYPGAMCDVESYTYLPLLEETGFVPSERYAHAPEILCHAQRIARHWDLYRDALFHTTATEMEWVEDDYEWVVHTDRRDVLRSPFVVLADGAFSHLKLPAIPGIKAFKGHSFHTSRWDYGITGGDHGKPLDRLSDKRVGVIGTGATALQCVPPLGEYSEDLFVFQRTPSTVARRGNRLTDPDWAAQLRPGWQKERMQSFTALLAGEVGIVDLIQDGWTEFWHYLSSDPALRQMTPDEAARIVEERDAAKMDEIRCRIDSLVSDRATAEALKPYYRYLCKRPGFHDEYLNTFNRSNVHLVDTCGKGVERITERGVVANGREYPLDLIVFATGFDNENGYARKIGIDIAGKDGTKLADKWSDGLSTLHGLVTGGFPNLIVLPGPNSQAAVTVNFMHLIVENAGHVAYILSEVRSRGHASFNVDAEAEAAWVAEIVAHARDNVAFLEECTPGRFNNEGRFDERSLRDANYQPGPVAFFEMLDEWRRRGDMAGLVLS